MHLEKFLCDWDEQGVLREIYQYKLLFVESRDIKESNLAVFNYKMACDAGKGAILLCVVRGHISEGVNFNDHYGRCCIVMGVPYLYSLSRDLNIKKEYISMEMDIDEDEYYAFDALRQSIQCIGRTIRNKRDYSYVIFADHRYDNKSIYEKLPKWIKEQLPIPHHNLSVEMAVVMARDFYKKIAQKDSVTLKTLSAQEIPEFLIHHNCICLFGIIR